MATNRELYQSILASLKRMEPYLDSIPLKIAMAEELTEVDEILSNLASYAEEEHRA